MKWNNPGHEYDSIIERIGDKNLILIYGMGEFGRNVGRTLKSINVPFSFIDREEQSDIYGGGGYKS